MSKFLNIEELPEFDDHRSVHFLCDKKSGLKAFISIHRGGIEQPAFGASRFWEYKTETDALRDSLRLSRMMSYKSAMAGLVYGGAKGVIIANGIKDKKAVLRAYAEKLKYLSGHFITGTDVGLSREDLLIMARVSNSFVGLRTNPEKTTVEGIFEALDACLLEVFGDSKIENRSFAVQGLGKTGWRILEKLNHQNVRVFATDIDKSKVQRAKKLFPKFSFVNPDAIYTQKADVFMPCALSSILNRATIKKIEAKIIIGAANNQLESEDLGKLLMLKNILYAPDYVANAGGLMSVVGEYESQGGDAMKSKIKIIGSNMRRIIAVSKTKRLPTNLVANKIAENVFSHVA